jgi:hypothetical protein
MQPGTVPGHEQGGPWAQPGAGQPGQQQFGYPNGQPQQPAPQQGAQPPGDGPAMPPWAQQ